MSFVKIKYTFIFDPEQLWKSQPSFNSDLGMLFKAKNVDVHWVKEINQEDVIGDVTLLLTPKPEQVQDNEATKPQAKLKQMSKARGYDGKYK